ncbi:MAG: hypothetical protein CMJ58_27635 [Planctomycetaceae bacterium]|nr:hypothetical protein [Planctomycetaceae bacterium]
MDNQPVIKGAKGVAVYLGLGTPPARAFVGATIAGCGAYACGIPRAAFDDEGKCRPFKPFAAGVEGTYYHFLAIPLAVGVATYLFT